MDSSGPAEFIYFSSDTWTHLSWAPYDLKVRNKLLTYKEINGRVRVTFVADSSESLYQIYKRLFYELLIAQILLKK